MSSDTLWMLLFARGTQTTGDRIDKRPFNNSLEKTRAGAGQLSTEKNNGPASFLHKGTQTVSLPADLLF